MITGLHDSLIVESGYLARGWRVFRILLKPRCELLFYGCDAPDADLSGLWWLGGEMDGHSLSATLTDADGGIFPLRFSFDRAERI